MAIWRHTLGQSAAKAASDRVSAELAASLIDSQDAADERFTEVYEQVFAILESLATQDDEAYEGKSDAKPARASGSKSKSVAKKGGGKGKGKGPNLEDAMTLELNFGAFEGVALGDLLNISAEEAEEDYAYGDGERSGRDYLAWLASDKCSREFVRIRARLIAEAEGIDYES